MGTTVVISGVTLCVFCGYLAVSGAVPAHHIWFSVAWPAYLAAVNRFRFQNNISIASKGTSSLVPEAWVKNYAAFAGFVAILLPIISVLLSISAEPVVLRIVGPHLYLIVAQVACECFSSGSRVAMLPRMLVPIGFNTYRMWALCEWCRAAVAASLGHWHVALAVFNLVFWAYNLFVFLLLRMVPLYLNPAKAAV